MMISYRLMPSDGFFAGTYQFISAHTYNREGKSSTQRVFFNIYLTYVRADDRMTILNFKFFHDQIIGIFP